VNFAIDAIFLWSHRGERRDVQFARNRVNVITGESHTGKTALLDIIDYCFLSSKHNLPDSIINENTAWYGLKVHINDKEFVLARRSPSGSNVSEDYYFSSTVDIPAVPHANTGRDEVRNILEAEFTIDERVTVAYGGRALKAGSKVSFRYFLLFNTVSEDTITNSKVFFDRQDEERYREALPRIFDIALGIDDLANIIAREEQERLRREIARLERKERHLSERRETFDEEARAIAARAAEFGLIADAPADVSIAVLHQAIHDAAEPVSAGNLDRHGEVSGKLFLVNRRLRKLEQFRQEYKAYKETLRSSEDSLKPLDQLLKRSSGVVKSEVFDDLISSLKADLLRVKESISPRRPVDGQITSMVKALSQERSELEAELAALPLAPKSFDSLREKWLFVGEARGKLDTYLEGTTSQTSAAEGPDVERLREKMEAIEVRDADESRDAVLALVNEIALSMLGEIGEVMANYSTYQPVFNYKDKRLQLRKPRSQVIENVGSSSNHMFLHLLHFLALHEVAISQKSPFIPTFLVLDQPSRPYYGDGKSADTKKKLSHSDNAKIAAAFRLMNDFIVRVNKDYSAEFQMIVFEHVPVEIFSEMSHVHLVEEFRDGNALIPEQWLAQ
jgi:hypothetical protein